MNRFDLIAASMRSSEPILHFSDEPELSISESTLLRPTHTSRICGNDPLSSTLGKLPSDIREAISMLRAIDHVLDSCRSRRLLGGELTSARTLQDRVQRQVLCVRAWYTLTQSERDICSREEHECCRVTAILYSTAVVYALPASSGWHHPLLRQLETIFLSSPLLEKDDASQLVLWSLCVSAIAAFSTSLHSWHLSALRSVLKRKNIQSWAAVEYEIACFPWCARACSRGIAFLRRALSL